MSEDTLKALPAIDQIANGGHLLMMKAALPYMPQPGQRFMALYIKTLELTNIMDFYQSASDMSVCSLEPEQTSATEMLEDIRSFCNQAEQESIDQCINMFQMMNLFMSFQNTDGNPDDMLKNFLSPEQQSLFETYQTMFSTS